MKPMIGVIAHTDLNPLGMATSATPLAYTSAIENAGGVPVIVPFSTSADSIGAMLAPFQGLLIPGGKDIDPQFYDESPLPQLGAVDPALDRFQCTVLEIAIDRKLPLLAVCRGMQLVNVALGGSLFQDIPTQFTDPTLPHMDGKADTEHLIDIQPGSRLYRLFGARITVNSHHHQSLKAVAPGLVITAQAPDGVVEAAQHEHLPIDLVQWHPERMMQKNDLMQPLFNAFIETCHKAYPS